MSKDSADSVEFIRIWQESKSVKEVAETLGQTIEAVLSRATRYRSKNVRLQIFPEEPAAIGESSEKKAVEYVVVTSDLEHVNQLCSTGWYYVKDSYMRDEGLLFVVCRLQKQRTW